MAAKKTKKKTYLVYDPARVLENGSDEIWLLDADTEAEAVALYGAEAFSVFGTAYDVDTITVAVQEIGTATYRLTRPRHVVVEAI